MNKTIIIIFLLLTSTLSAQTNKEMELFNLVNEYRAEFNLPPIPYSPSLSFVAQVHVRDLEHHKPYNSNTNAHSWSDKGPWTAVDYYPDHRNVEGGWKKPAELTQYSGYGYEIVITHFWMDVLPKTLLDGWKGSAVHNALIINRGEWEDAEWKAMGIGIYGQYAAIWFGKEEDPGCECPDPDQYFSEP